MAGKQHSAKATVRLKGIQGLQIQRSSRGCEVMMMMMMCGTEGKKVVQEAERSEPTEGCVTCGFFSRSSGLPDVLFPG